MFRFFSNLKIGLKIGLGFTIVLVLLAAVAASGLIGLNEASRGFTGYRELARDANLAGRLQANLLLMRMAVKNYMEDESEQAAAEYRDRHTMMLSFLEQAREDIKDPERAALIEEVAGEVEQYDGLFAEMLELGRASETALARVLETGWSTVDSLKALAEQSRTNMDFRDAFDLESLLAKLLEARLIMATYLYKSQDPDDAATALGLLDAVKSELGTIRMVAVDEELKDALGEVGEKLDIYIDNSAIIVENNARKFAIIDELDTIGPEVAEDLEQVKLSVIKDQDELGTQKLEGNRRAVAEMELFTIAAVVLGMFLAVLITLGIVRPLKRAIAAAGHVAEGDFDHEIDDRRKDEMGEIIRAVGRVQTTIVGMKAEIDRVVDRIGYGELGARGEEGGFQGGYAELVRGVNFMADTYTGYIDETPAPIIIIDREMGLVFANRAAREAVGLDLEAIAGRKCHELMRTGDCKTPDCACARAMQTNAKQESETIARPGDAEMDIRYVGVPIVKDGEVVGAFEIVMDQTAIKQSQRTMQGVAERAEQLAEHLASSSQELAAQVEQIARGSETQRSRMEETATAMEQMNTSVREVADNAGSASAGASETMQQAVEGADAVRRVVSGIDEVREMTQKLKADIEGLGAQADNIGNVITVIEDIADQTNLLALNAAIEAARAGDAGRGFAVVADEVRKLAEKTMEATKQVAHNISAIQTAVRESQDKMASAATTVDSVTDVAGESGRSLEEIVRLMETNAGQVEGIATASEEQSASSEEINRAVEDVRRIVEETSEGMRQSSRAVEELAQMSGELNTLIEDLQKA